MPGTANAMSRKSLRSIVGEIAATPWMRLPSAISRIHTRYDPHPQCSPLSFLAVLLTKVVNHSGNVVKFSDQPIFMPVLHPSQAVSREQRRCALLHVSLTVSLSTAGKLWPLTVIPSVNLSMC